MTNIERYTLICALLFPTGVAGGLLWDAPVAYMRAADRARQY